MMMKLLTDIMTGVDNKTFDNGRVLSITSFISYYVLALINILEGHSWSAMEFASGIGAMAVGFGIHLKLKSDTEPK
jgi:hypothetical protein